MMDETELISRSKKGDRGSFDKLLEIYESQVYNLALRMLGDPASAQDAAQEAFISAFRGMSGFRGGSFRAWLLRIAANACYDYLRSSKRHRSASLEDMLEQPGSLPRSKAESPENHAERMELGHEIAEGLASLPAEQRLAVILSDIHGLSYDEIAEVTHTSLGTVKSRLSRGRANLRDYLLKHAELLPHRFRQYR